MNNSWWALLAFILSPLLGWSSESLIKPQPKETLILPLYSEDLPVRELQHLDRLLRLEALKSRLIAPLSEEKWKQSVPEGTAKIPAYCFTQSCLSKAASTYSAIQWVLAGKLEEDPLYYRFVIRIYDKEHGKILIDYQNKRQKSSIDHNRLLKESLKEALRRSALGLSKGDKIKTHKSQLRHGIWAGALALGALATFTLDQSGFFKKVKANEDLILAESGESHNNYSSLRGFFSLPALMPAAAGMGGALQASIQSPLATTLNPAGLAHIPAQTLSFSQSEISALIPSFTLAYGGPVTHGFSTGFLARREGDRVGNETVLNLGTGVDLALFFPALNELLLGTNLRCYLAQVGELGTGQDRSKGYSWGYGFDLGIQFPLTEKIRFGSTLRDPWSRIYHQNTVTGQSYQETLPPLWVLGFAYKPIHSTLLAVDGEKGFMAGQYDRICLGGSWTYADFLTGRLGTQQLLGKELSRFFTLGFGMHGSAEPYTLNIDYAFQLSLDMKNSIGNQHQFGIEIGF